VTVENAASDATDPVTVWGRKKPERDPEREVRLPDGLMMPAARRVTNEVDLEDWICEGDRQIAEYEESFRVLLIPLAIALISGGIVGALTDRVGWIAVIVGVLVMVYQVVETYVRRHVLRDRWRRVDAYRKQLRDLRIPPNTGSASSHPEHQDPPPVTST